MVPQSTTNLDSRSSNVQIVVATAAAKVLEAKELLSELVRDMNNETTNKLFSLLSLHLVLFLFSSITNLIADSPRPHGKTVSGFVEHAELAASNTQLILLEQVTADDDETDEPATRLVQ